MAGSDEKSPFNMWWVAAGGLVVLALIAGGIVVFLTGRNSGQQEAAQSNPAQSQAAEPGAGNGQADTSGKCNVPAGDQGKADASPQTTWKLYDQQMKVPTSEKYGPINQDGKFWRCYAHSPKGAVFAGANLTTVFSVGAVKDAAIDTPERAAIFEEQTSSDGASGQLAELKGFRVEKYTGTKAQISYYAVSGDIKGSITTDLAWDSTVNDWRLDFTNGEQAFSQSVDPAGFVTWGTK